MMRALAASSVALYAVAACRSPTPPVEPAEPLPAAAVVDAGVPEQVSLDRDLPQLAARASKLYQEIAQAFATAGADCPGATTRLRALQQTHADVITANAKVLHDGRARELRAALEPHAEALDASAKAIVDSSTMRTCSQDRAFTDAFDELVGSPP